MKNDYALSLVIGGIPLILGMLVLAVGISREPIELAPAEPVKLENPEQPSHRKINNVLSKHHPDLFKYCESFEHDMRGNINGQVVSTDVTQTYGVTNEGDISHIHINCVVKYRVQSNLFLYNDYLFETKTNKMKFKQVHNEYNQLVHLIKL